MYHSNTNGEGFDTDGSTLAAGLLTTTAILSDDPGHQCLRRITAYMTAYIAVSRFISIKETTYYYDENDHLQSSSSSSDSSPLINNEIQTNSSQQEASDTNNLVPEDIGLLNIVSRTYNNFSSRSSRYHETSSTSNDIVTTESPVDQEQLQHRNKVAQIVKVRDLISLKDFGGVEKVASIFGSDLESGIRSSIQEAERQLACPLAQRSSKKDLNMDGMMELSYLLQFLCSSRRARKLEKERNKLNVTVVRRQEQVITTISNLVPGDIVCLKEGELVPADGLVVSSDGLELDGVLNSKIDRDRHPFLFFGSRVKEGCGRMLATSVGDQTELAKLMSSAVQDPIDDEEIFHMHWSGAASTISNMFSHYYESNGTSLAIHEGMRNKFENYIQEMEGRGLRSMAFACRQTEVKEIQEDGLYLLPLAGMKYTCPEEIKTAVDAFKKEGVFIKLVSEEDLSAVRAIACELGILSPESDDQLVELELELEEIQDLESPERMKKMTLMTLMGSFLAEHNLRLVRSMQQKGDVVALFGGSLISNTPALKAADIGITEGTSRTMASESSDIIIKATDSLSTSLKFGRCAYHNIKKFSQLQLTVCISGLLITLVTAMSLKESSITALQLIWVNWITCILGGLMMVMELPIPPANRTKSLLTKAMSKNIALQVLSGFCTVDLPVQGTSYTGHEPRCSKSDDLQWFHHITGFQSVICHEPGEERGISICPQKHLVSVGSGDCHSYASSGG
ncbi:hypothetical protein Ddye_015844 [Dipteronia dyeriana]|uniref:P-type ATPase A domain-containing protein n=1 Tax=Dipteronia dyeriana TaxID=168575 RepID=A0AAD9U6F4_9ROSI|nr:hypothetical protein Ddye_015844 [Dipteronia dyeriana]